MWRDTTPSPRHCSVHLQAVRLTHTYVHTQTHTQTPFPQFRLRRITTASTCSGVKALLHIAHHCKNPKSQQLASLVRPGLQTCGRLRGGVSTPAPAQRQAADKTGHSCPPPTHTHTRTQLPPPHNTSRSPWLDTCRTADVPPPTPRRHVPARRPRRQTAAVAVQCSAVQCSNTHRENVTSSCSSWPGPGRWSAIPARQWGENGFKRIQRVSV